MNRQLGKNLCLSMACLYLKAVDALPPPHPTSLHRHQFIYFFHIFQIIHLIHGKCDQISFADDSLNQNLIEALFDDPLIDAMFFPLTFIHDDVDHEYTTLFPLKLKGASSRSANARKLKGEEKVARMNEKRQIYSKIRVRKN